ncbi:MAG: hypothetical protein WAT71_10665 [Ignavibacteria bacterium]
METSKKPKRSKELALSENLIALQFHNSVIIIAQGSNNTSGYKVLLERTSNNVFPPKFKLYQILPVGLVLNTITPFTIVTTFQSDKYIKSISIEDRSGKHTISVLKISDEF